MEAVVSSELSWGVYFAQAALYMTILYTYFASVFEMRYRAWVTAGAYVVAAAADTSVMEIWSGGAANIIKSVLVFSLLIHLYRGSLRVRIERTLLIYMLAIVADTATALAIAFATQIPITEHQFGTVEYLYGMLGSKIFLTVLAKVVRDKLGHGMPRKLPALHWFALIVTPAGSIVILYNFLFMRAHSAMDAISAIIVVVINFIVLQVYDKILADYEAETKNKLLEEQIKYYGYQNYLATSSERIRHNVTHDLKNLLVGLRSDLQNQRLGRAEERIDSLLGDITYHEGPSQSGNFAVDAIINFKASIAAQEDVRIVVTALLPQNLDLDPSGITLVLGNALDNAIEAVRQIAEPGRRLIRVGLDYRQEALYLEVANPYTGEALTDKAGQLLSRKRGYRQPGVGMQSIRSALADGKGAVIVNSEGGEFRLQIVLYGIKIRENSTTGDAI